jgi:SAM-dependent methyltransferase
VRIAGPALHDTNEVQSCDPVEAFIATWADRRGGSERADAQSFINALCELLGVDKPHQAQAKGVSALDYGFERPVRFRFDDGTTSPGRIDLYKRGSFVLEAKQSRKRQEGGEAYEQLPLQLRGGGGVASPLERPRSKIRGSLDALLRSAKRQAEDYARCLDEWPPFIIVVDVGSVIELYANFRRDGKGYEQFPDRNGFRIRLDELRHDRVRDRLRAVWDNPFSLDPTTHAAEVTQGIAALLARMTQSIEARAKLDEPTQRAEHAYKVSKFLMRCIFAMFAEDMELLPKGGFLRLIQEYKGNARHFHIVADQFFAEMDKGVKFSPLLRAEIKRFNGGLFRDAVTVQITEDELTLLEKAALRDWRNVEPAIFGTLLEQALSERERAKLGAHYTPRTYVERLVVPTVIEPLRDDWEAVQSDAIGKLLEAGEGPAREVVKRFHDRLCDTLVLDPACGTGNFLYVSLELMKRLEGEVLDFLKELGEASEPLRTVDPHQFLGIEKNPRAAPIAELVLWIGYIQWWFRTRQRAVMQEPVLRDFGTIKVRDAVLEYDREELLRDSRGRPLTRQDPNATKLHPITGEMVLDPDAKLPIYRYINPRPSVWPEADFIVGNPPFIGGKDLRAELGDGYVEALWASRGKKSDSIDFVMYWWDQAAAILRAKGSRLRRFGLITTNSIVQRFSRRVLEKHLNAPSAGISLVFAVPDHPWIRTSKGMGKKAAIRIAMTVAEKGQRTGRLAEVITESALGTDRPHVMFVLKEGGIRPDLTLGADLASATPLRAGEGVCYRGVQLMGSGFIVTPAEAVGLGLGRVPGLKAHIHPYRNGRDLNERPRGVMVVDLLGLSEADVRQKFPAVYQRVLTRVKPERDTNNRKSYRDAWWLFGEPRRELRPALVALSRYIATVETSKHRVFEFLDRCILPDNMVVAIASASAYHLGVLSSRMHTTWALRAGGWLGVGNDPRYSKSRCFDPFPFPAATRAQEAAIGGLAEELDALRKRVIAEHEFLTMTRLYNVRERLVRIEAWQRREASAVASPEGPPPALTEVETAVHDAGCVAVLHELHKKIDAAVAEAYGWAADLSDGQMLARLVELNRERTEEERNGLVRWLRADYQLPRFREGRTANREEQIEAMLTPPKAEPAALPRSDTELLTLLRDVLRAHGRPTEPREIAARFGEGARAARRVERGLQLLAAAGVARRAETGWFVGDRAG